MTSPWISELVPLWNTTYPNIVANYLVHCPGRVNLIGEHVDHQAYPVCPCAIEQSIGMMVSVESKTDSNILLELHHANSLYETRVYNSYEDVKVDQDRKTWANYICAAYFGVVEFFANGRQPNSVGKLILPSKGLTSEQFALFSSFAQSPLNFSLRILVNGDIPPCAGLSSSAAVVVASTLAFLRASGSEIPSNEIVADLCAKSEQYGGVASGGMDQAAELLSQEGSATLIRFKPLNTECVKLPEDAALIIVNTCRESPKAKLAAKMYNKRVFELKAGCLALLPKEFAKSLTVDQLLDLQLRDVVRDHLKMTESEMLSKLPELMEEKPWSKDQMLEIFTQERMDALLDLRCGRNVWEQNDDFSIFQRVRHVLSETDRVEQFAIVNSDTHLSDEEKLERLGNLMNASNLSMNEDFEASCPEIEEVTKIARKYGAKGARVTGAGWGGCAVVLTTKDNSKNIITGITTEYFEPIMNGTRVLETALEALPESLSKLTQAIFATTPSRGAFIVPLN